MFISQETIDRKRAILDTVVRHGTDCECKLCETFHNAPNGESTNAVMRMEAADVVV